MTKSSEEDINDNKYPRELLEHLSAAEIDETVAQIASNRELWVLLVNWLKTGNREDWKIAYKRFIRDKHPNLDEFNVTNFIFPIFEKLKTQVAENATRFSDEERQRLFGPKPSVRPLNIAPRDGLPPAGELRLTMRTSKE